MPGAARGWRTLFRYDNEAIGARAPGRWDEEDEAWLGEDSTAEDGGEESESEGERMEMDDFMAVMGEVSSEEGNEGEEGEGEGEGGNEDMYGA